MSLEYVHVTVAILGRIAYKVGQPIHVYAYHWIYIDVECPYPLYGDDCRRNCTSQCHINGTVSMECHHIEGPNCTCHSDYTGELCQTSTLHINCTPLLNKCLRVKN